MKQNVGGIDKIIRIALGVVLIVLALMGIGTPWTWIGVLPLATGLIGWCPLYPLLGINTCKTKESGSGQSS
ncbi:MAG: DUF2892 domain-containing protein [Rhodocyclales bacterium]|nr:DUF2892 domain-containing protein [Rhodocyclales bacterium]